MCKREYSQKGIVTLKKKKQKNKPQKTCVKKAYALERSMDMNFSDCHISMLTFQYHFSLLTEN